MTNDEYNIIINLLRLELEAGNHASGSRMLSIYIRMRRVHLTMDCVRAAELAGLQLSYWFALEEGWIPDLGDATWWAIAGTLEVRRELLTQLAVCDVL